MSLEKLTKTNLTELSRSITDKVFIKISQFENTQESDTENNSDEDFVCDIHKELSVRDEVTF